MIKVSRTNRRILVDGHAHYAPTGQDIVCSAVSALTQTLAVALQELTDDLRGVDGMDIDPSPGLVSIWIKDEQNNTAKTLIDAYMLGISGIANSYPDHVRIIENENAEGANATVAGTTKEENND